MPNNSPESNRTLVSVRLSPQVYGHLVILGAFNGNLSLGNNAATFVEEGLARLAEEDPALKASFEAFDSTLPE